MTNILPFMLTLNSSQKYVSSLWILLTQEVRLNTLDDFPEMSLCSSRRALVMGWFIWKSSTPLWEFPIHLFWSVVLFLIFHLEYLPFVSQVFAAWVDVRIMRCCFCFLCGRLKGVEINEKFEYVTSETNVQRSTSTAFSKLLLSINKTACSNEPSWKRVTNDVNVN